MSSIHTFPEFIIGDIRVLEKCWSFWYKFQMIFHNIFNLCQWQLIATFVKALPVNQDDIMSEWCTELWYIVISVTNWGCISRKVRIHKKEWILLNYSTINNICSKDCWHKDIISFYIYFKYGIAIKHP